MVTVCAWHGLSFDRTGDFRNSDLRGIPFSLCVKQNACGGDRRYSGTWRVADRAHDLQRVELCYAETVSDHPVSVVFFTGVIPSGVASGGRHQ